MTTSVRDHAVCSAVEWWNAKFLCLFCRLGLLLHMKANGHILWTTWHGMVLFVNSSTRTLRYSAKIKGPWRLWMSHVFRVCSCNQCWWSLDQNSFLWQVASVDSFQGREKDFIILSCVRSNEHQVRLFCWSWINSLEKDFWIYSLVILPPNVWHVVDLRLAPAEEFQIVWELATLNLFCEVLITHGTFGGLSRALVFLMIHGG
jgi:hypothetical protein